MAILAFQKPDRVIMNKANEFEGQFEFRPLEPGFGLTVGNALRRILLSSLQGFAITSVKVEGVDHEFSTIKGVVEDVCEIILNLKQVRLKLEVDELSGKQEKIYLSLKGKDVFTAGDIEKHTQSFKVMNPELVICNMDKSINLDMEIVVSEGRGYVPSEENKVESAAIGTIAIDSIFTPIKNAKYHIENFRVEQKTDYEKLIMELTTDGTIHPEDALKEAAKILIEHFLLFADENLLLDAKTTKEEDEVDEEFLRMRKLLKTKLTDLDLSVRALNCLKAAEIKSLGDLVTYDVADMLKFRNFGKKSLVELEELLRAKNLSFGLNVAKYKLEDEQQQQQ
ncbi:MAG: DNA-directed RNA polymerase subunit alpha [Deltaproteobacteria bacterium]|nr:DNA-directed RNA polymerase subunit alpha [Deltaproteobacteria bacterium]